MNGERPRQFELKTGRDLRFFVIGSSHRVAPVVVRERLAVDSQTIESMLIDLIDKTGISEASLISTCNRFECYCCAETAEPIVAWLADRAGLTVDSIRSRLYHYEGRDAVAHLFRVACGLDSLMVGETQILRQVKTAFETARRLGKQGKWLKSLGQAALTAAKSIRHQSHIGQYAASIPAALLNLVRKFAVNRREADLASLSVLFIGAGEIVSLCATHLSNVGFAGMTIANRNLKRAQTIARAIEGDAIALDALSSDLLSRYDIVISCTASDRPLLSKDRVASSLSLRDHHPMLLVDLAVPRDIDEAAAELTDVSLVSIDDLGDLAQAGQAKRQMAAAQAEAMVLQRADEFIDWWRHRRHIPLIFELQRQAETVNQAEIERAVRELAQGAAAEQVLHQFGQRLVNKLLHVPIQALHDAGGDDRLADRVIIGYGIDDIGSPPLTVTI